MLSEQRAMEILSYHLSTLLGHDYQYGLPKIYSLLQTEEGRPALQEDIHSTHLATLRALIQQEAPSFIVDCISSLIEQCLPLYHEWHQENPQKSISEALERVESAIHKMQESKVKWNRCTLALKALEAIQRGYQSALLEPDLNVERRVSVVIFDRGYYSLDVKTARRLLCITERGEELKKNKNGTRAVYAMGGMHGKSDPRAAIRDMREGRKWDSEVLKGVRPNLEPVKEYMVSCLMQSIGGRKPLMVAPTGLWSLSEVPLEREDIKKTGGIVQTSLSIEGMCLHEFLLLREAVRFFKKALSEKAFMDLLEDQRQGYLQFLALAKEHFPQTFFDSPAENEEEVHARSALFQECFSALCENTPTENCFEEIRNFRLGKMAEPGQAWAFRKLYELYELYEKHQENLNLLQVLLVLTKENPQFMRGQSIESSLRFLKKLPLLFELFPTKSEKEVVEEIEKVLTDYLDKEAASAFGVSTLLSLPTDNKLDNLRLLLEYDSEGNLRYCRIVSIDNDLGLSMPFVKTGEMEAGKAKLGLKLKNTLWWLEELQHQVIAPGVCKRLLASSAYSQWLTWLCLAARRNQAQRAWGELKVLDAEETTRLQVSVSPQVLNFILKQWEALRCVLLDPSAENMTHQALLEALYPAVAMSYKAFSQEVVHKAVQEANIIDHEQLFYAACKLSNYYEIYFPSKELIGENEKDRSDLYQQALEQSGPDVEKMSQEERAEVEVEISQFALDLLRKENWANYSEEELWPLLEAYSLLDATQEDWESNIPPEGREAFWQSGLILAIKKASPFVAHRFLSYGASVGLADENGQTPLHYFCELYLKYEDSLAVEMMGEVLLSHPSAKLNVYDANGNTPLLLWAQVSILADLDEARTQMAYRFFSALCRQGADPNLAHGIGNHFLLDMMLEQIEEKGNCFGFGYAVKKGARICRDMRKALQWCRAYAHDSTMQEALKVLKDNSVMWTWHWNAKQLKEKKGRPAQRVLSKKPFLLPLPLWAVCEQAIFKWPPTTTKEVQVKVEDEGLRKVWGMEYETAAGEKIKLHVKLRPEMPLMELGSALFLNTLWGDMVAPSDCIRILDDEKRSHVTLFSQTVPGLTLSETLENLGDNLEAHQDFHRCLDSRQTSAQIVGAMLIHPEDGKGNNYMVRCRDNPDGKKCAEIIAIDTDHAFIEPFNSKEELELKTILFCLEAMQAPLHPVWRERLLGLSVDAFLAQWMQRMSEYQKKANDLFDKNTRINLQKSGFPGFWRSKRADLPVTMTFPLHEEAVRSLCERFYELQAILRENSDPQMTHLELLKRLNPALWKSYAKAFEQYPEAHQVLARFKLVCGKGYGKEGETIKTTQEVLQAMRLPSAQEEAIQKQDEKALFTP